MATLSARNGRCARCGECCRVISLDFTKRELVALAQGEARHLVTHPHSKHRAAITRLLRDVAFIGRHFHRVSRGEALRRQPRFRGGDFTGRSFFTCDALTAKGQCRAHTARPFVCEGYPWYGSAPNRRLLVVTPCGYESALDA